MADVQQGDKETVKEEMMVNIDEDDEIVSYRPMSAYCKDICTLIFMNFQKNLVSQCNIVSIKVILGKLYSCN